MKKPSFTLIRYPLLCALLLSTTAMAMEPDQRNDPPSIKKMSLNYPTPPVVTFQDYVDTLIFEDGKMGRWVKPKGPLASWLQSTANKMRLEDLDGNSLEGFPLFLTTLCPVVDKKGLRCDYALPAADSDLSRKPFTFSLFCDDATSEEIDAVAKLKPESFSDYTTRLLEWQDMLRTKQQVTNAIMSQLLNEKFMPDATTPASYDEPEKVLVAGLQSARNEKLFFYFNFDGATGQLKTHSMFAGKYEPQLRGMTPDEIMERGKKSNMDAPAAEEGPFDCLYSDSGAFLNQGALYLQSSLLNINGPLVIQAPTLKFENMLIWPVGALVFQSDSEDCPIKKIKITPCNSTKPMRVWAHLNFSATPTVKLETLNAAIIVLRFREQK